jgi:hypothetical protein
LTRTGPGPAVGSDQPAHSAGTSGVPRLGAGLSGPIVARDTGRKVAEDTRSSPRPISCSSQHFVGEWLDSSRGHPGDSGNTEAFSDHGDHQMSERNWKEEQRSVLTRLFDSVFERREASEDQVKHDIQRLGTVNKHLESKD